MKRIENHKIIILVNFMVILISIPLSFFVSWGYLGFVGFSFGSLLGYYVRYKKNKQLKIKSLYILFAIIGLALALSIMIYYHLNINGLYYIIGINIILMVVTIYYLIKNMKNIP